MITIDKEIGRGECKMKELIKVLEELTFVFEELLKSADQKLDAARNNHIVGIDDCLRREQAILMKLKGLENKRDKMMGELGYGNKTGNEIIDLVEKESKREYTHALQQLNHAVMLYRNIHQEIMVLINCNVKQIEKQMIEKQN